MRVGKLFFDWAELLFDWKQRRLDWTQSQKGPQGREWLFSTGTCSGVHWGALGCFGALWAASGCFGLHWAALGCIGLLWAAVAPRELEKTGAILGGFGFFHWDVQWGATAMPFDFII